MIFQFGDRFLKDKPNTVVLYLKSGGKRALPITDDRGVIFNPGEPVTLIHTFVPPGQEKVVHMRLIEVIPWESIERVTLEYPPLEETDPKVWEVKNVATDLASLGPDSMAIAS